MKILQLIYEFLAVCSAAVSHHHLLALVLCLRMASAYACQVLDIGAAQPRKTF